MLSDILLPDEKYTFSFNRVYKNLPLGATFKQAPEDFIVEEHIPFSLTGEGEHCWLYIKKRLLNTDDVAQKLAKFAGVKSLAIGYAGLKDKYALTSQWFSVQLPGRESPDWSQLESDQLQVLASTRHSRKLQRGALSHNCFSIRLRDVSALEDGVDCFALLDQRCKEISISGVPNYFGRQRFGRGLNNLNAAIEMFAGTERGHKAAPGSGSGGKTRHSSRGRTKRISRHQRSLYLSSARSWIFNHILSLRVEQGTWNQRLPGDVFMLDAKSGCFIDDGDTLLDTRLQHFEIHPTAVLWGDGDTMSIADCRQLEQFVVDHFPEFRDGLIAARVEAKRRALRLRVVNLDGRQQGDDYLLDFQLPPGTYATVVLDELLVLNSNKSA